MDLLLEGSPESRIVSARHVVAKAVTMDEPLNASLCGTTELPDITSFYAAIAPWGYVLGAAGAVFLCAILALWADVLRTVLRRHASSVKTHTAVVISIYPVVVASSLVSVLVPRAQLLSEAITQAYFMLAFYQFFCLTVAYNGGESEFVRRLKPTPLDTRVLPLCCFPWCLLPRPHVTKRVLLCLRMLVLQLPVVQGLIYMVMLVIWAEEENLYHVNFVFFQPFVVTSIFTGVWGLIMTVKASQSTAPESLKIRPKFVAVQLVLICTKIQIIPIKISANSGILPCFHPLTPPVYLNLIYNFVLMIEMILLMMWARKLYKNTPDLDEVSRNVQEVKICNGKKSVSCETGDKTVKEVDGNGVFNTGYSDEN